MEIGTNPESWGRMAASEANPLLDWQGLRARFMAGYAMRHELRDPEPASPSGGSFDARFARILHDFAAYQVAGLATVNPTPSGDGNSPSGKNTPVAGNNRPVNEE